MFLWLSPDSRKPGRLHFAGVAGESVSAPFPDFKQWLKLFFGCPALFDSCDGVGGGGVSASVECGPSVRGTGEGFARLGSSGLIRFSQSVIITANFLVF